MSQILEKLIKSANTTPIHGVQVGLFGCFFSDMAEFPMDDTSDIGNVAAKVKEAYGSRAFGFRRLYYLNGEKHFIDKGWVYLMGVVTPAEEILRRNLPGEEIVRDNIKVNGIKAIIECLGWHFVFNPDEDLVLE